MPIDLNSISFANEFNSATTDYLIGNVCDAINNEIVSDTYWRSEAESGNKFSIARNKITREIGSWWSDGFDVGDEIFVFALNEANRITTTIIHINVRGTVISCSDTFPINEETDSVNYNFQVYGFSPLVAAEFFYNLIENDLAPDFVGLTDPVEQRYKTRGLDAWSTVVKTFRPQGFSRAWITGSCTIQGDTPKFEASGVNKLNITNSSNLITKDSGTWDDYNIDDIIQISDANAANNGFYKIIENHVAGTLRLDRNLGFTESSTTADVKIISYQRFKIAHNFWMTPFFLADQLDSMQDGIPAPSYFYGDDCLKYVFRIITKKSPTDPNKIFTYTNDGQLGNTGWFDENYNGEVAIYSVESITYKDTVTLESVDAVQYCRKTDIEIIIQSSENVFLGGYDAPKFVLHHFYCPLDETWYQQNEHLYRTNFLYDRALQIAGDAAVNGDYSMFEDVTATVLSATRLKINAKIDLTALSIYELDTDDRNYCIAVSIQDRLDTDADNDRVTVKCDVNEYYCNLDNEDLWGVYDEVQFYEHPYYNINGKTDVKGWVEDSILSDTVFWYDIGSVSNPNSIKELYVTIEAEKTATGETYRMEIYSFSNLFRRAIVQNGVQQVELDTTRNFKLVFGNNKNWLKLDRRGDLDGVGGATRYYYQIYYAFKIRWEDWIYDSRVPADFYDILLEQNGLNKDWQEKFAKAGWAIKFRVNAGVEEIATETHTTEFQHSCDMNILNYDDDNDSDNSWTGQIKTYDISDTDLNENIITYGNTKVKATFFKQVNGVYPTNPYGILEIAEYQSQGIYGIRQISSVYETERNTPWISQNSPDDKKAKVTGNGVDEIYVEATIDHTVLDPTKQYVLSARMGEYNPPEEEDFKVWCCGNNGTILSTIDSGTVWNTEVSGTANELNSIDFINSFVGWCCGDSGTMLKSVDSGTTWASQSLVGFGNVNSVFAVTTQLVYAACNYDSWSGSTTSSLYTTDGGTTWIPLVNGIATSDNMYSVFFINSTTGWMCGQSGKIYKTTNGTTWVAQTSGVATNLYSIFFTDASNGWACGASGVILHTPDGGVNWNPQTSGLFNNINSIFFIDSSNGWACGTNGDIRFTTDGGTNWNPQAKVGGSQKQSICFGNLLVGWSCDTGGFISFTDDGGTTWVFQTSGTVNRLNSIDVL